ncbi:MAG TPA: SBBP repeat-containing protein, partial [Candidatus Kapabacteria bacterium]|nr:SBBP repeat-containing protein [Candidatus Kapabacteria bacterium]
YVTGYFNSAILEFNNGITLNNTGSNNAYIAKYDSEGDCSWAELISGTGSIYSQSIFVDLAGNVYITGYFNSTAINFNNNITLTNSASVDIFIAKYNSFAECQWAQKASGNLNDIARSITVDNNGNIFITGNFNSDIVSFNSGISLNRIGNSFYHDAFLSKYNSNGICQWATSIFGTNNEYSNSVTIDDTGNIYIVGTYSSDTVYFNNGINLTKEGQYTTHLFLAKYNTSGVCQWAEKTSSQTNTEVTSLKADNNGSVYFTGSTFSPIQFNNNVIIEASQRFGFVAKYDYSGVCQWAEGITGIMAQAQVTSVNFDISGNPYICGQYSGMSGTNLIFNNDITLIGNGTTIAGFLAKYNTSGVCQWAENYNGIGNIYNFNMNLSVNNSNEIYLTGNYGSTLEFNNNISLLNLGQSDGYIAKYTQTQETTGYELWGWEQWNTTLNQYGNDKDWSSISTYKEWFSSVIKTDGTLWRIWYPDDDFQVGTDNNWSKAAEGYMHTLALKENGTLWAWGDNYQGQLGLGVEFGYEENPVQIGTESDWAEINAGWYTSFAIKS